MTEKNIPKEVLNEQDIKFLLTALRKINFLSAVSMETIDKMQHDFLKSLLKKEKTDNKRRNTGYSILCNKKWKVSCI